MPSILPGSRIIKATDPGSGSTAKNLSIFNQCSEFAGKLDPDMHQSGNLDPDPHQSEKQDPDPVRIKV